MKGDDWKAGPRMPFIVRWPGKVKPDSSTGQSICFTDVLATLAEIVGEDLPADQATDSFSFLNVLLGRQPEDQPVRGPVVVPLSRGKMTIRSGPWKLIAGLAGAPDIEQRVVGDVARQRLA